MPWPSRAFRHRGLKTLLVGQIPADFADWLDFVAIGALLAFVWQVDPEVFAWLGLAVGLPYLVIGLWSGALVDRFDLRWVLVGSNLGRAATTFALAFVGAVPALLVVAFARSGVDAFFTPAKQAAIQALVPEPDRLTINGISHAINQASKVLGPSVGGGLLIGLEPRAVFLANAGVSLLAALILLGLPRHIRPAAGGEDDRQSLWRAVGDGLAEVRGRPVVAWSLALMAAAYLAMFLYDRFIVLLVGAFGLDEVVFGLAIAAVGAGGVAGALGLGLGRPGGDFGPIAAGFLAAGLLVGGLGGAQVAGLPLAAAPLVGLFFLVGVATALVMVPFRTVLQREVNPQRTARVFATSEALNVTAMLAAPFLGALIARMAGPGAPFLAGGALLILLAMVAGWLHRRFR